MAKKTDPSGAPDFGALADAAVTTSEPVTATSATALDELAADLVSGVRQPELDASTLRDITTPPPPGEPARRRDPRRRHDIPSGRPRGRPRKDGAAPGTVDTRDTRQTKAELLAENETLRAQVDAMAARDNPEKIAELATSFRMLAHVGFALVAEARGPHWRLNEPEEKTLGETLATAAAPHAEMIEAQLPWAAPVLALVGIVGKRVIEDVRIQRARQPVAVVDGAGTLGTGPV